MNGRGIPRHVQLESGSDFAGIDCPGIVHEVSMLLKTRVWIFAIPGPLDTPCYVWQGHVDAQGYPDQGRKRDRPHRRLWEIEHGPRSDGHVVHHRCENKLCLNVAHLDLITRAQHVRVHRAGKPLVGGRPGRSKDTA
jgi:hypothetical protein